MAFTAITEDIGLQPGVKLYNFKASGAIVKGQGVALSPGKAGYVFVPTEGGHAACSGHRLIGIADYTVATEEPIAIYGPYNLVQAKLSGSQSAGTLVGLISGGYLADWSKYMRQAIVVKGVTETGNGEVMILADPSGQA